MSLLLQLHFNSYQQLEFQFSHPRQNPAPTAARGWEANRVKQRKGMPPIAFPASLPTPQVLSWCLLLAAPARPAPARLAQLPRVRLERALRGRRTPWPRQAQRMAARSHQKANSNLPVFMISFKIGGFILGVTSAPGETLKPVRKQSWVAQALNTLESYNIYVFRDILYLCNFKTLVAF